MSVHNPLPITIIQMGHVEKLAEVAQNQATVQQQVTQEETARKMREKQVDPVQPLDQAKIGEESEPKHQTPNEEQSPAKQSSMPDAETDKASEPTDPLTGILVNVKV